MRNERFARRLPSYLKFWRHATSLGGVESLIDWRALHDPQADGRLLRLSVGLEDFEDLRRDLERGFARVGGGAGGGKGEGEKEVEGDGLGSEKVGEGGRIGMMVGKSKL